MGKAIASCEILPTVDELVKGTQFSKPEGTEVMQGFYYYFMSTSGESSLSREDWYGSRRVRFGKNGLPV